MKNPENPLENHDAEKTGKLPVIEEQLKIEKEIIETGSLQLVKRVHQEDHLVDVPLVQENITVEHVPVNHYVENPPLIRQEGDTTIYPVLKEVLVKRLLLVEEVRVTRHRSETPAPQKVTLRKEEVQVNRQNEIRVENVNNPDNNPS